MTVQREIRKCLSFTAIIYFVVTVLFAGDTNLSKAGMVFSIAGGIEQRPETLSSGIWCGPFFWDDFDVHGSERTRAIGPFWERQEMANMEFMAVRPFFSETSDESQKKIVRDYLWPIGTTRIRGDDEYWRFLCFFGHNFEVNKDDGRYRTIIFPITAWGRDIKGRFYLAAFPFGGRLREFLGRDELDFVLFPLYMESSVNSIVTRDFLWPIVSWSRGKDIHRFRIFPFYGFSSIEDRWKKSFVLWPIWTYAHYYMPYEQGRAFILFPLIGNISTTKQKGWMLLPPFFKWARSEKRHEINCPWPFIQYASGDLDKLYLWPIVGRQAVGHSKDRFILWPLIQMQEGSTGESIFKRTMVLPFLFHESHYAKTSQQAGSRYFKVWPLLSYERKLDESRVRIPSLWPLKNIRGIEQNWAPLWTIYEHISTTNEVDENILWGIWKRRSSPEESRFVLFPLFDIQKTADKTTKWSILKGIIGWENTREIKKLRIFYLFSIKSKQK